MIEFKKINDFKIGVKPYDGNRHLIKFDNDWIDCCHWDSDANVWLNGCYAVGRTANAIEWAELE